VGLVDKWLLELRDKFGLKAERITSRQEWETAQSELRHSRKRRVYVVPFSNLERIAKESFDLLVIDEIHNFRNRETQGWKTARALASKCRRRLGLSATPINNETVDLANIYAILFPQYNPLVTDAVLVEAWDARDIESFSGTLTRFTKEHLGIHFARRRIWEVAVNYPDAYASWVLKAVETATGKRPTSGKFPMETVTYFRGAASSPPAFANMTNAGPAPITEDPKAQALLQLIRERSDRLIVFCQFRHTVEYLAGLITDREVFTLTGTVPAFERGSVIKAFAGVKDGVLIMTAVGSEGLDLQFCSAVANYDLHWNPMVLEQRIGRIDRIGQKKDEVNVFNFHVSNSIDEKVLQTIKRKLDLTTGTPLATTGVSSTKPLYDADSLKREAQEADQFVKAMGAYAGMSLEDEEILDSIDSSFCLPGKFDAGKPAAWLRQDAKSKAWLDGVTRSQAKLATELDRYQKLVGV
jgi:SNF2 family DNA or RNA helicase